MADSYVTKSQADRMRKTGMEWEAALFFELYHALTEKLNQVEAREILKMAMYLGREKQTDILRELVNDHTPLGLAKLWNLLYGTDLNSKRIFALQDDLFIIQGTGCAAFELFKRWGMPETEIRLIADSFCVSDYGQAKSFNPEIRFRHNSRLMSGDSVCEWHYSLGTNNIPRRREQIESNEASVDLVPRVLASRMLKTGIEAQGALFLATYQILCKKMTTEDARELLKVSLYQAGRRLGEEFRSLVSEEDALGIAKAWSLMYGVDLEGERVVHLSRDLVLLKGGGCPAFEMWKRWGISTDEMKFLAPAYCAGDHGFVEGFSSKVKLTHTSRLLEGDKSCMYKFEFLGKSVERNK